MAEKKAKVAVHTEPSRMQVDENSLSPLVDIYQTDDGTTYLAAEIPGVELKDIDVRVDKGVLTISARPGPREHDPKYSRTYVGFATGQFFRAFALGDEVDREKIEASLTDGVLTLKLPRAAAAQTRKIEVKSE